MPCSFLFFYRFVFCSYTIMKSLRVLLMRCVFFLWEGQYHLLRNFFILSQSLSSFMSISLPEISSSHYIPRTSSIFQKSAISSITDFTSEVIHFSFLAVYTSLWDTKASSLLQLSTFVKVTWVYHLNQGGNKWHTLLCLNWITDE